jgi:hypothetical protein
MLQKIAKKEIRYKENLRNFIFDSVIYFLTNITLKIIRRISLAMKVIGPWLGHIHHTEQQIHKG